MTQRPFFFLTAVAVTAFVLASCESEGDGSSYTLPDTPPNAEDDFAEASSGVATVIEVLDNDSDAEDDQLEVDDVTQPLNGAVEISGTSKRVEYTSEEGFSGVDTFTYTAIDDDGNTASATVTVDVSSPPTLVILSPADGEVLPEGPVLVTWEVAGCEVTGPNNNPDGCHLHRYVDREGYSDDDSGTGWYGRFDFELFDLPPGPHLLWLRLHRNDGSDGAWAPTVEQEIQICVETCEEPEGDED
jgi:hypothetical protein